MTTTMVIGITTREAVAADAPGSATSSSSSSSSSKRADALHEEGVAFVDEGKYAEACPRFAESLRLDPAVGTQFNLADCYEHIGRKGSALILFLEVEKAAHAAGKTKLEQRAHARAETLAPKVARATIAFAGDPKLPYVVKIDDVVVMSASASASASSSASPSKEGVPVDPGEHSIVVGAEGYRSWRSRITFKDGRNDVSVPTLERAERQVVVEADPQRGRVLRISSVALAGIGVVGLGIGAGFGINAINKRNEARRVCGEQKPDLCFDEQGAALWDQAVTAGNVSTIAFVSGAVLLALGGVLWIASPRSPPSSASASALRRVIDIGLLGGGTF